MCQQVLTQSIQLIAFFLLELIAFFYWREHHFCEATNLRISAKTKPSPHKGFPIYSNAEPSKLGQCKIQAKFFISIFRPPRSVWRLKVKTRNKTQLFAELNGIKIISKPLF